METSAEPRTIIAIYMRADEDGPEFEATLEHGLELLDLGKFDNLYFDSDFFEDNSEHRNATLGHLEEREEERLYNTPAGPRTELALESPLDLGAVVRKNRSAYNLFIKEKVCQTHAVFQAELLQDPGPWSQASHGAAIA